MSGSVEFFGVGVRNTGWHGFVFSDGIAHFVASPSKHDRQSLTVLFVLRYAFHRNAN